MVCSYHIDNTKTHLIMFLNFDSSVEIFESITLTILES